MPNKPASALLDTSVLVRFTAPADPLHHQTVEALAKIAGENTILCICPQVMAEFRQVATRPEKSNGLGWDSDRAARAMDAFEREFSLLPEPHSTYIAWRRIVETVKAVGRANFDARIVAVAEAQHIEAVLTYEADAFARYGAISSVLILRPKDI